MEAKVSPEKDSGMTEQEAMQIVMDIASSCLVELEESLGSKSRISSDDSDESLRERFKDENKLRRAEEIREGYIALDIVEKVNWTL